MKYIINTYEHNFENTLRFLLGFDSENPLIVLEVNPSTADDQKADATLRRVLGYAERNGFDGFLMINVYPVRSTNPKDLPSKVDPAIHRQNLNHILDVFRRHNSATVLAAFGNPIDERDYLKDCLLDIIRESQQFDLKWKQIGDLTKCGNPRHPSRGAYVALKDFDTTRYL